MTVTRRDFLRAASATAATLTVAGCGGSDDTDVRTSPNDALPPGHASALQDTTAGAFYSTDFDLRENPISEAGVWFNTSQPWTKVRTYNGIAFGTNGDRDSYDDSYAYLSGFGADQQGQAVVYVDPYLTGDPHEVEILLRCADSAQSARCYECLFNHQGGVQIVRWNGAFGDFTVLSGSGPGYLGRDLVDGDVVKGTVIGNTITAYINGVLMVQATDSMWTDGQPGIGFFKRTSGQNWDLAIYSYIASSALAGPSLGPAPAPPPPGLVYATSFALSEYPISEAGVWSNRSQIWTKVRTDNRLAFGTNGAREMYDHSYAYLSGFAPDQQAEAVIYVDPNITGDPHQFLLLLRCADSAQSTRCYACLFNHQGGMQIMRWNGPFGDFTELHAGQLGYLGRNLAEGDVVQASIIGNTITTYVNGAPMLEASDSMWADGQPGIGFFKRTAGENWDLAITSYSARSL